MERVRRDSFLSSIAQGLPHIQANAGFVASIILVAPFLMYSTQIWTLLLFQFGEALGIPSSPNSGLLGVLAIPFSIFLFLFSILLRVTLEVGLVLSLQNQKPSLEILKQILLSPTTMLRLVLTTIILYVLFYIPNLLMILLIQTGVSPGFVAYQIVSTIVLSFIYACFSFSWMILVFKQTLVPWAIRESILLARGSILKISAMYFLLMLPQLLSPLLANMQAFRDLPIPVIGVTLIHTGLQMATTAFHMLFFSAGIAVAYHQLTAEPKSAPAETAPSPD